MRVLIVEDDKIINSNLIKLLAINGYAADGALTYQEAISKIDYAEYDLILLDITLPDGSGLKILKQFRIANKNAGVIITSARDSKTIIKNALDAGADDYMVKPVDAEELLGRIRAVLRRISIPANGIICLQNVEIDRDKKIVFRIHKQKRIKIDTTKKEYSILEYMALNPEKVLSQEEIIEHVWDENADPFSGAIRTHIKNLRKKLGNMIETVKGVGYRIKK